MTDACAYWAAYCLGYCYVCAQMRHLPHTKPKTKKEKNMIELKDTINMMNSEDYKERFMAEYLQTKIRYEKLHRMTVKWEAGTLDFEPSCPIELLKKQKAAMGEYLHCLEIRAEIEKVPIYAVKRMVNSHD